MRTVVAEFACRFWFPYSGGSNRVEWGWQRHRERVVFQLSGGGDVVHLPPPFFSYSARTADLCRLHFYQKDGRLVFALNYNGHHLATDVEWRDTSLWSQVTFNGPYLDYPGANNGPWWLRWRVIGGDTSRDILTDIMARLAELELAALSDPHDPFVDPRGTIAEIRREVILYGLAAPARDRIDRQNS